MYERCSGWSGPREWLCVGTRGLYCVLATCISLRRTTHPNLNPIKKILTVIGAAVLTLSAPLALAADFPLEVVAPQIHTETKQQVLEYFVYGDGGYFSYVDCKTDPILPKGITRRCRNDSEYSQFVTGIELYKNNKRYAFYDNVLDAKFSTNGRFLAIWNAVKKPAGEYVEQKKIIDVITKKTTLLPFEDCTARIANFNGNNLVTVANEPWSQDGIVPLPPSICIWSTGGKLIAKVQAKGLATATTDRIYNQMGMIPREKQALFVLGKFTGLPEDDNGFCQLAVIDTNHPEKTLFKQFSTKYWHYNCFSEIELDLSQFTFTSPIVRFREQENASALWTNWQLAQVENVK